MKILKSQFLTDFFRTALMLVFVGSFTAHICNAASDGPAIRVGSEVEFPPFAFVDENGEAAGFSVDLIKSVSDAAGLSIVISTGSWNSMWNGLVDGQFDVLPIVAKSPERQLLIDFSLPHTETFDAFFVRDGNPAIRNLADAQGKQIVVMRSDAAHHALLKLKFQGDMVLVETIPEGLSLIVSGQYDAFLCSKLIGTLVINKHGIRGLTAGPLVPDYKRVFAFGVKKGADELREKLDQGLLIVKASGEYERIYEKWLGFDDPWRKYRDYGFIIFFAAIGIVLMTFLWLAILRRQVRTRTAELAAKNEALEQEIADHHRSRQTLIETENRFRIAQEISPDAFTILRSIRDAQGQITDFEWTYANPAAGRILKQAPEKLIGQRLLEVLPGNLENRALFERYVRIAESGQGDEAELEYRSEGISGWFRNMTVRLGDGVAVSFCDITHRKQAEAILRKSKAESDIMVAERTVELGKLLERLNLATRAARLGIWDWDIRKNKLVWDERMYELYGIHREDFAGAYEAWLHGIHPDDKARCDEVSHLARQGERDYDTEFRIVWSDGTIRSLKAYGQVVRDSDGTPSRMIGVNYDITDRKQVENSLRETNEYLENLFNYANAPIIVWDSEFRIMRFNHAFEIITGRVASEVIGKSLEILFPPDQINASMELIRKTLTGERWETIEINIRHVDASIRTVLWNSATLFSADGKIPTATIAQGQDITARKQAEEELIRYKDHLEELVKTRTSELNIAKEKAEAANIAKSRFLANMSHELRTPLNIIMGFSRLLLRDKALMPDSQEKLNTIVKSGEHLLELINEVLAMSKIETGSIYLSENEFDLPQLLDTIESMYAYRARHKGIGLRFEPVSELPRFVRSDEMKFRQVLLNLLGNAIKFTSQGHVIVRIGYSQDDSRLSVEVEDTGSGIAPEETEFLFQPFAQTESGRQNTEGTGLGLAISKKYVELMGGELSVESQPGKGSIFRFHIRAEKAEIRKISEKSPERRVIRLEPGQPVYRILVAEDNYDNRNMLCSLLRQVGFEVSEAINGQEAVELWKTASVHLILMDMRMPVMDGYEAVRIIRKGVKCDVLSVKEKITHNTFHLTHNTPIIAVTAYAFEEDRKAVMAAGCDDFIRKPFDETELFRKIAVYLGVRYVYEERYVREKPVGTELKSGDLAELPAEWLAELRHAAMRGNSEHILELAARIRNEQPDIADMLTDLVRTWQFKKIADLIPANKNE